MNNWGGVSTYNRMMHAVSHGLQYFEGNQQSLLDAKILPLIAQERTLFHRQVAQLNTTKNQKNAEGAPSLRFVQGWVFLFVLIPS